MILYSYAPKETVVAVGLNLLVSTPWCVRVCSTRSIDEARLRADVVAAPYVVARRPCPAGECDEAE